MSYCQRESLVFFLLKNDYFRNPFEILKKFINMEKNINLILYFKKKLIFNCLDILRFHKLYFYNFMNFIKIVYLDIVSIMENLRLEIAINIYKISRIHKIQSSNLVTLLKKNVNKLNYSEKIYVLKLFKLINFYIIKNLTIIFPINFIRFKYSILKFIETSKTLFKFKNSYMVQHINKFSNFFLLYKTKIIFLNCSYQYWLLFKLQYLKSLLHTFLM
uniref:Uncharacterized protein n=1 Tax=Lotharella vacuolata TaxID=74820 RepID=A0A0H5BQU8_9EUKA|nr:hypothetical protein [Lotharella vacuolata]